MSARVRIHRVRLGGDEFRVIRADPPPGRLALRDDHHWLSMYADRDGAAGLVALWALAARSARSLVHLPIRATPVPEGVVGEGEPVALDLVLVHHSLQFSAASWKRIRARLGAGSPHTATTPGHAFPDETVIDHARRHHREFRDHLDFDIAAHTLFVVGSSTAFREHGTALRGLVEEAPSHAHRHPGAGHFCVELGTGPWPHADTRRQVPGCLHIESARTASTPVSASSSFRRVLVDCWRKRRQASARPSRSQWACSATDWSSALRSSLMSEIHTPRAVLK